MIYFLVFVLPFFKSFGGRRKGDKEERDGKREEEADEVEGRGREREVRECVC